MAWPLETLVDLLATFLETYVPFETVGGTVVSAEVLLLHDVLGKRAGLDTRAYFDAVTPIIAKVLVAEGLGKGSLAWAWLEKADRELLWITRSGQGGAPADDSLLREAIHRCVVAAKGELASRLELGRYSRQAAAAWLREALLPELERLRPVVAEPGGRTGYFASPAVFHQLALGLRAKSAFVQVRTVGTAMNHSDLVVWQGNSWSE